MFKTRDRFILRTTVGYTLFALAWIFFSDRLLESFTNIDALLWLSTAKGVLFVLVSAVGLYLSLRAVPPSGQGGSEELLDQLAVGLVARQRNPWLTYGLAIAVTLATLAMRNAMVVDFNNRLLLILFMLPIVLSALLGGLGPGLLSTAIAAIGVDYFSISPVHGFRIDSSIDLFQWLLLILNGGAVSMLSEVLMRSKSKSDLDRRLLDAVVSGTSDAIFVKDAKGRYLLVNDAAAGFVGKTRKEIIGNDDSVVFENKTGDELMLIDRHVIASGQVQTHEESVITRDGETLTFLVIKGPLFDEARTVVGLFGISRDISERKQAETRIRNSEAFNRATLDSIDAEIAVLDSSGVIVAVNQKWNQFARENGVDPDSLAANFGVGVNYLEACKGNIGSTSDVAISARIGIESVLSGRRNRFVLEYPCHSTDLQRWFSMTVTPMAASGGGAVVTHIDITQRKHIENNLQNTAARLKVILESSPVPMVIVENGVKMAFVNAAYRKVLGYTLDDIPTVATWWPRVYPDPDYRQAVMEEWSRRVTQSERDGTPFAAMEADVLCHDGKVRTFLMTSEKIGESSQYTTLIIFVDITEQKKTERDLKEAQRIGRIGSMVWDIAADKFTWSEEIYRILGLEAGSPPFKYPDIQQCFSAHSWGEISIAVEQCLKHGQSYSLDVEVVRPDGGRVWATTFGEVIRDAKGNAIQLRSILQDISDRHRAETAIRESEERLKLATHSTSDGIWDWNLRTGVVYRSPNYYAIVERQPEAGDSNIEFFKSTVYPDDLPHALARIEAHLRGDAELIEFDYRLNSPSGKMKWMRVKGRIVERGADGAGVRVVGNLADITSRKLAALALQESEWALKEAQRLSRTGNWIWDPATNVAVWSDEMYRIYDRDPALPPASFPEIQDSYAPESWVTIQALTKELLTSGTSYVTDLEIIRHSGAHIWVIARGERELGADGHTLRLRGTVMDISERKQIELLLNEAQTLANLGTWSFDVPSGVIVWSKEMYRIFGRDPALPPLNLEDSEPYYTKAAWPKASKIIRDALESCTPYEFDTELIREDGSSCWVIARGDSVRNADGAITAMHGTVQDITERKKNEQKLEEAQRLSKLASWELNNKTGELFWSSELYRIFGRNPQLPPPSNTEARQYYTEAGFNQVFNAFSEAMATGSAYNVDAEIIREDGSHGWIAARGEASFDADGSVIELHGTIQDITERKKTEQQLIKLAQAVEQSPESVVITDLDASIEYVNESFVRTSGYSREELMGRNSRLLQSGQTPVDTYESMWNNLTRGVTWEGEFYNQRKDGSHYVEHAIVSPIRQTSGEITHYIAVKEDITEKIRSADRIYRLANYDPLTELPNRSLLLEQITQTLAAASRNGQISALMLFNIDRFKTINDAVGQSLGDTLLQKVTQRLGHNLREVDFVARIVGDEFGILLVDLSLQQQAAANLVLHVADKVHGSLREPFVIGEESITLTTSLGVALFPENAQDSALDILRRANTALHHSKHRGGEQTAFFEGGLDEQAKQRFNTEHELHHALGAGQLRVFLQPQVNSVGQDVGAEALVRWQHPQRGLLPPGAFVPIAEETNLIIELGVWVLNEVCKLLVRENSAIAPIRIAVNISPRHFRQSGFVNQIKQILANTGADPARLMLEVTEGMLIDNINDVISKMNELNAIGIHFSLDDFGTGYSSLSYLKRLPINELKIDRTFVQDITTDGNDASLVETILAIAKHLHLQVVAEGVETAEQAAFLNQRGQVIHQGYYFGKPEPIDSWLARIKKAK